MKVYKLPELGIEVAIEYKKIKNMYLRIGSPEARVKLSAPVRTSEKYIAQFIQSRAVWIREHRERILNARERTDRCDGNLWLWGECLPLIRLPGAKKRLEISEGKGRLYGFTQEENAGSFIDSQYKSILAAQIELCAPRCERLCNLQASEYKIRKMKSRWGSCNINQKRICVNLQLVKYPIICLEYVILHELLHLIYPNHAAEFKLALSRIMPDWRSRKSILES